MKKSTLIFLTLLIVIFPLITNISLAETNKAPELFLGKTLIADIAEKTSPAVVSIDWERKIKQTVWDPFSDFFKFEPSFKERIIPIKSAGSGFIYNEKGYIITNEHVIHNSKEAKLNITLPDGRKYTAKLIGSDESLDLAVLKINGSNLPTIKLGNSDKIRPGEWVIAIGNPYRFSHTVTFGIISATGRDLEDLRKNNLIQTDAAINPGNSGGPLINLDGEVIGINVAIAAQAQNIGFAIPINAAKEILDVLVSKGKIARGMLGVSIRDLDEQIINYFGLKTKEGVIIVGIDANSPAEKYGLKKYDIIKKVNGQKVTSSEDLQKKISSHKPGETLTIEILREDKTIDKKIVLGEK